MKTRFLMVLLSMMLFACKNSEQEPTQSEPKTVPSAIAFEAAKWQTKSGNGYPYREAMLHDLMTQQQLKTLSREAILNKLGTPDRTDGNYLFYQIWQKRLVFFPLGTKTLVIKFKKDATVEWIKIHQ